jgi:hypothetical protein
MSFLSLPRELRDMIYAYAAVPYQPLSHYQGLLLSCHQIRAEINHACASALRVYCQSLEASAKGVRASIPAALQSPGRYTLRLSLSTKCFTDYPSDSERETPSPRTTLFRNVASSYFNSITIAFYVENDVLFGIDHVRWINQNIVHPLSHGGITIRARSVAIKKPMKCGFGGCDRFLGALMRAQLRPNSYKSQYCVPMWAIDDRNSDNIVLTKQDGKQ